DGRQLEDVIAAIGHPRATGQLATFIHLSATERNERPGIAEGLFQVNQVAVSVEIGTRVASDQHVASVVDVLREALLAPPRQKIAAHAVLVEEGVRNSQNRRMADNLPA